MSKISERKAFLELIERAAKEYGAKCTIKSDFIKGNPTTRIEVRKDTHVGVYNMRPDYDLGGQTSKTDVLIYLFTRDRAQWPSILPGSKKQVNISDARKETTMRQPRPARTDIAMKMASHKPTGSFAALAALAA